MSVRCIEIKMPNGFTSGILKNLKSASNQKEKKISVTMKSTCRQFEGRFCLKRL